MPGSTGQTGDADQQQASKRSRDDEKTRKRREAELRNKRFRVLGPLQKRVSEVEERISKLEAEQADRSRQLADPTVYDDARRRDQLIGDYQSGASKLAELTGRWEAAQEELDQLETELAAQEAKEALAAGEP